MQRFRALCQRYAGWILITLALLLCQRWWMARNKPERLLEVPEGYVFLSLHNGILTLQKSVRPSIQQSITRIRRPGSSHLIPVMSPETTPTALALFTMPVTGGPLRPAPSTSLVAVPPDVLFKSGTDMYRAEYRKTSRLVGIPPGYSIGNGVGGTTGSSIQTPSPPPTPKPPFHVVTEREEADQIMATLHRLSSSGVPSPETITLPMGYYVFSTVGATPETMASEFKSHIAFSGDAVYWLNRYPDERTYHVSSNGQRVGETVYKYRSAIMTMPLHGGTPRKLLETVSESTTLLASENSVLCWIYKDNRQNWLRLRPDGTSQLVFTNISLGDNPVESNNHLYLWRFDRQAADQSSTVQILQVNADGSGQRILGSIAHTYGIKMQSWRGQVYFRADDARTPDQSQDISKSTLYRVNPALPSGMERLCSLPDNTEQILFDGDYAYCLTQEVKSGFAESFRTNETRNVLYRYPLPAK